MSVYVWNMWCVHGNMCCVCGACGMYLCVLLWWSDTLLETQRIAGTLPPVPPTLVLHTVSSTGTVTHHEPSIAAEHQDQYAPICLCAACPPPPPPPTPPLTRHCSLLVKPVWGKHDGGPSDLMFSHTAWFGYETMTRVYKRYDFPLTMDGTSGRVPATSIAFSSYPAAVFSYDDWLQTSAGLGISGAV